MREKKEMNGKFHVLAKRLPPNPFGYVPRAPLGLILYAQRRNPTPKRKRYQNDPKKTKVLKHASSTPNPHANYR
jgi:hypothetical protein